MEHLSVRATCTAEPAVRLLIADGHALVRAGFRLLLDDCAEIEVVGEAATGAEAIAQAGRLRPDVVLMDAGLPGHDQADAIERMVARSGAAVMLLAGSEPDDRIVAALRAGASGMLLKDIEPAELISGIAIVARGDALLSPPIVRLLIVELVAQPVCRRPEHGSLAELTAREREVTALVAQGLTNPEIAERLVITPTTVKTHVGRAMVKLGARDRAQLVAFAYEVGLAPVVASTATGVLGRPVIALDPTVSR